ncbi:hypothetical protein [Sorangium sp. So ce1024]|uniref:hypothetical protein n=1 Tax=Sorangium sp. So ce1024 TaxID=3133327 RepID=UPI003F0342DC
MKQVARAVLGGVALAAALAGCGGDGGAGGAPATGADAAQASASASASARVTIHVTASERTNGGASMYMMVRAVGQGLLASESYQDAAARLFAAPADETILDSRPVFPGRRADVTVTVPEAEKRSLLLYFFFTDPDGQWRAHVPGPLPAEVFVALGERRIARVERRKR